MGWTFTRLIYPEKTKEWMDNEVKRWNKNATLLASNYKGGIYYAAVRYLQEDNTYVTFALVCPMSNKNKEIGYKHMDESSGPVYYDASKAVYNALMKYKNEAPQDEYSKKWREEVKKRLENCVKPLKEGNIIKFNEPIKFTNGFSCDVFRVLKYGRKLRFMAHYADKDDCFICKISRENLKEIGYTVLK